MNRESYDAIADAWDAARAAFHGPERKYLDVLLDGIPIGSDILDLGCGTGRPIAEYALGKGYGVVGVDQAQALLAVARFRFPAATWINSTIEAFASDRQFRAIVCWDALFHIDRREHERLFAKFARMLTPGGRIMMTLGGSDHPSFTDSMFGHTFFYDSHPPETALRLLAGAGFEPIIAEFLDRPTSGRDKGRYAVVAHAA